MFGKNLKTLRKKNNLTQEDLANSLTVSRQAVCMWERGERTPKVSVVKKVAAMFSIPIDQMINHNLPTHNNELDDKKGSK